MAKKKTRNYKYKPLYQRILIQLARMLLFVFLFYTFITQLVVDSAVVGSRSMEPGLKPGDKIFFSRIPIGMKIPFTDIGFPPISIPERGSVVALDSPFARNKTIPVLTEFWNFISINNRIGFGRHGLGRSGFGARETAARSIILRRVIAVPGDRVYLSSGRAYVQPRAAGDFLEENLLVKEEYRLVLPESEFDSPDLMPAYYSSTFTVPDGKLFLLPDNRLEALGSNSWGMTAIDAVQGMVILSY